MCPRVTIAAFLWSLAATASAQSGAEITMPPNARQTGLFPFANICPTAQTFSISAAPPQDWLRPEPPTVEVGADSSFAVRVTVNTAADRSLGKYRSSVVVICTSCAGTEPPCLQDAKELAISLTVASVKAPGEFSPMAAPNVAPPIPATTASAAPRLIIPTDPPPSKQKRLLPFVALGLLATGAMGGIVALRGLLARNKLAVAQSNAAVGDKPLEEQPRAESERHQVRR
jgi:hypothetical protein